MNNDVIASITTYTPKGDKVVNVSKKHAMYIFGFILSMYMLLGPLGSELEKFIEKKQTETFIPTMQSLADKGSDDAALWLIKNDFKNNSHRIKLLAEKDVPQAMFYQGMLLQSQGQVDEGLALIKHAADKGNFDSIKYLSINNVIFEPVRLGL